LMLGTMPKTKVDVSALLVSANNALRGGTYTTERWPPSAAISLRGLAGVLEPVVLTASMDETIGVLALGYDQSHH
jgi:hypothetical protein